jgi:hypothetical protein
MSNRTVVRIIPITWVVQAVGTVLWVVEPTRWLALTGIGLLAGVIVFWLVVIGGDMIRAGRDVFVRGDGYEPVRRLRPGPTPPTEATSPDER